MLQIYVDKKHRLKTIQKDPDLIWDFVKSSWLDVELISAKSYQKETLNLAEILLYLKGFSNVVWPNIANHSVREDELMQSLASSWTWNGPICIRKCNKSTIYEFPWGSGADT